MKRTFKMFKKNLYTKQTDALINIFYSYFTDVKMPQSASKSWVIEHLYIFLYMISNFDRLLDSEQLVRGVNNNINVLITLSIHSFIYLNYLFKSFILKFIV